ncbi:hypothetical protein V2G26_006880 [Clonostachys chloroleuca]
MSTFCILFERSHGAPYPSSQRDADIIVAYCSARMSAVSDIDPKMTAVRMVSPNEQAFTEMQQHVKEHEVCIELLAGKIDSLSKHYTNRPNMPSSAFIYGGSPTSRGVYQENCTDA